MKRFSKILLSLIVLLSFTASVDAASSYISAKKSTNRMEYIDNLEIYYNKAGALDLYILDIDTYFSSSMNLRNPSVTDKGFTSIIKNNNLTNNDEKDYYIKQVAILWYEDYLNGNNNNLSSTMKSYISSNTDDRVCYHIVNLVNNAKNNRYNDDNAIVFENNNIYFTKSGSYYYSNEIEFTTNDLTTTPTISLSNAPKSATIVEKDLTKNGSNSFKIRIPVSNLNSFDDEEFTVSVKGKDSSDKTYEYSSTNGGYESILGQLSSSTGDSITESLTIFVGNYNDYNTKVRIKVLNENGNYIKGIKYYIYEGNCKNSTCSSSDYIDSFTTTSSYTTLNNILSAGTYTFVRKTTTNYDLAEKELVYIDNTTSTQTVSIYEDDYDYDYDDDYDYDYDDDYYYDNSYGYNTFTIYNDINDNGNYIKIYTTNGDLVKSYKSSQTSYIVSLKEGNYYLVDSKNILNKLYFKVTENNELMVKYNNEYIKVNNIDLNKNTYKDDYFYDDFISDGFNNDEYCQNNNCEYSCNNDSCENNSAFDNIEITNDVNTTTDVKVSWVSNIIDTPITDLSSTLKYIVGAIILGTGLCLVIKNVKKSKNNI